MESDSLAHSYAHLQRAAFIYLTLRVCQKQHERGGLIIVWVPVLTAILANLHGGFIALPAIVATAAVGHAISGPWDQARQRNVIKFFLAFLASCLTALFNPYGWDLYRLVYNLLIISSVTSLISEYQSAPFGKPEAGVLEMVLLALVGLSAISNRRVDRYHLVHLLVWLHLALTSIRNAPLFALVAAAPLATLLDSRPRAVRSGWLEHARNSLWVPGLVMGLMILVAAGAQLGEFDRQQWPLSALATLNNQPASSRLFHEQDWGGLIEAECRPIRSSTLTTVFCSSARPPSLNTATCSPAAQPGILSATAIVLTWSGSSPTAAWRNGCSRSRTGPSSSEIPSRCSLAENQHKAWATRVRPG